MGEPKFTSGPWVAAAHFAQRAGGRTYIPVLRPGNDPVPLAIVHRDVDGYGKSEGEANARLIAAAPDLYAALKLVIESGAIRGAVADQVWKAIDKADGTASPRLDVVAGPGDEGGPCRGEPTQ